MYRISKKYPVPGKHLWSRKSFFQALDSVDLTLPEKQISTILVPNGAGKTTLLMPPFIRKISYLLPITHASTAIRELFLIDPGSRLMGPSLTYLAGFAALSLPLGFFVFHHGLRKAKRDGSLVQF